MRGHRSTVSHVISNLLSNAIKFVAPGVIPEVQVRAQMRGDLVRITIEDNGIGVPADQRERFEASGPDTIVVMRDLPRLAAYRRLGAVQRLIEPPDVGLLR